MSDRRVSPQLVAILAVVGAAMLFGTSGTARELGPEDASSLTVGAARVTIGAIVLWVVVVARRRREPIPSGPTLASMWRPLALGGLGVAAYTPLFFVAVDHSGVAVGTVVAIASGPFFAAALEWRLRGQRPTAGWWKGTVVTVIGVVVLVAVVDTGTPAAAGVDLVGLGAALGAGLGYATYSVTSKSTMDRGLGSTVSLAVPFSIGVAVVLMLSAREAWAWMVSWEGIALALYLGIAATGLAYVLFGFGLGRLASSTTVTLVLAEPLTAALLAVIVLDESIPPSGWLGVAAVIVGLAIVGRSAVVPGRVVQSSG